MTSMDTIPARTEPKTSFDLLGFISRWGTIISLVGLVVVFTVLEGDRFATSRNFLNVLNQVSILAIVASGLTVCLVMGLFDLSIAANVTLGGYLAVRWSVAAGESGVVPVILAVLLIGALIGVVNGILVGYGGISAFIVTLAMGSVISGALIGYSDTLTISSGVPEAFKVIGQGRVGSVPAPVLVMAGVLLLLLLLLERTEPGRHLYAIGSNQEAARLVGIRVKRYALLALGISAACAAIAGMVASANIGVGRPHSVGDVYLLDSFAAAFIGASTLRPGQFHIFGTFVGVLLLGVINNGLSIIGAETFWQMIVKGLILIFAVFMSGVSIFKR
jgi:ribose transport system permease protein